MSAARRKKWWKRERWPLARQLRLRKPPIAALQLASVAYGHDLIAGRDAKAHA